MNHENKAPKDQYQNNAAQNGKKDQPQNRKSDKNQKQAVDKTENRA